MYDAKWCAYLVRVWEAGVWSGLDLQFWVSYCLQSGEITGGPMHASCRGAPGTRWWSAAESVSCCYPCPLHMLPSQQNAVQLTSSLLLRGLEASTM